MKDAISVMKAPQRRLLIIGVELLYSVLASSPAVLYFFLQRICLNLRVWFLISRLNSQVWKISSESNLDVWIECPLFCYRQFSNQFLLFALTCVKRFFFVFKRYNFYPSIVCPLSWTKWFSRVVERYKSTVFVFRPLACIKRFCVIFQ